MPSYIELIIPEPDPTRRDLLVPDLEALGFEGFEEEEDGLKAYIREDLLDELAFGKVAAAYGTVQRNVLPEQNWNLLWESNFEPVVIDDFCGIRAEFHPAITGVRHELVITPKMSFGTGHHATTRLMIESMRAMPIEDKRVVDFGTGTGVLAILAERLGARAIWALDNDPWSIDNARENRDRNEAGLVSLHLSASLDGVPVSDVILANINRHVLLEYMETLYSLLAPGGLLLLSGILLEDRVVIGEAAEKAGFAFDGERQALGWLAQLWKKALGIGQNNVT
ncbi:50S ribosomal protein L11 methyltransferase [Dinghuibacter silviterrae]|uniref:Ribosomal protein L11 methyltransferase n=1 Tax=Dinghuibacter silviterrae TaxID=1539049 RepID=A0A4R8DWR6_9BACT|nr:50S ribosomal protein L11 methyltransferase [Dinghuibacter silviterrae]TDX01661.1 ribosomal protein L11 methyltransferase [Dinghuibacter silviterrae]